MAEKAIALAAIESLCFERIIRDPFLSSLYISSQLITQVTRHVDLKLLQLYTLLSNDPNPQRNTVRAWASGLFCLFVTNNFADLLT